MNIVNLVKLGIDTLTSSALVEKGRNIITKMTGNANFPTPTPTIPEFTTVVDALETANALVLLNGGRQEFESRKVALADYSDALRRLANYVGCIAGGDREMIMSSGFETRKHPEPLGTLLAAKNLLASRSSFPNQVEVKWDGVRGRSSYQIWMTEGDPTVESGWKLVAQTTRNRYVATGLTALKYYSFRVAALGAAGSSPMSNSATALAA